MHGVTGLAQRAGAVTAAALTAVAVGFAGVGPAGAAPSPTSQVIINEVYGGGGNSGATFRNDFIELYNTGDTAVDVSGWTVQYASAAGTSWTTTPLTGSIAAGDHYLVQQAAGTGGSEDLPAPDVVGSLAMGGTAGKVALVSSGARLAGCGVDCSADASVVDFVGYGTANDYAGAGPAVGASNTASVARTGFVNTADNAADFTAGTPTPGAEPEQPGDPTPLTIAEIQGTGAVSPVVDTPVITEGVVTAAYPTGGFFGFVIQTPGTGGETDLSTRTGSDALFVYQQRGGAPTVAIGDRVRVTGTVAEFNGLTQVVVPDATGYEVLSDQAEPVDPVSVPWPTTDADREKLESMLFAPVGTYTVTNTFATHQFGEVGLAFGDTPLIQPTEVADPQDAAAVAAVAADNAARRVTLDDGASTNFTSSGGGQTPPYVSLTNPVRVGAPATFTTPLIVDYRNNVWKLSPTSQVTPGNETVTFKNTRTPAPDAEALGAADLTVAAFNVLNYFTTLGVDVPGCVPFVDREGNGTTVDECETENGPRGAWDAAQLERQEAKIVAAINALDADVVGLMEIENSAVVDGADAADEALATLVDALNAAAGSETWAYVPSSTELPDPSEQDVITNAIIYQPAAVERVGDPRALGELSGTGEPFVNAREPIGQAFAPADGGEPFFVAVNHLKSKGSPGPLPGDTDQGDGQGNANASRVAQATALRDWVPTVLDDYSEPITDVALVGDFNSYTQEDPLQVLYDAGYTDAATALGVPGEYSYSFQGMSGSLDHVLLNEGFLARSTGADIWEINGGEALGLEYSRYNATGTIFYAPDPYRSSDHDPVVVGLAANDTVAINLLNINDFHGRIDANTVKFAGTVEQLRAEGGELSTLLLGAGDLIGASTFASAIAADQPTIDVLNALDLDASAVGNHEFDAGLADLTDRVIADGTNAEWAYLGANVYAAGTTDPVLPEYALFDIDGVTVGVIGAVTEETPSLVLPAGIEGLEFGDPVAAVNRVAAALTDGDVTNGEADVLVAEYHEGAAAVTPGMTIEEALARGGTFAEIVNETSPEVDAIFTGHTHQEYAWSAPVPGEPNATRPVVQTGQYGENVGQAVLTVDQSTGDVLSHTQRTVDRTTVDDATLAATYPRVAEVKSIVDAALADAAEVGNQPVASVTADITTAFAGGAYTGPGNTYAGGTRDDRSSESTLGTLVANSLRDSLADPARGGAQIGVTNPGGLRGDLFYAPDGVVTYAEANGVLPFVNNLWTTTLTGAQFKVLLEQQWQRDVNGNVPTRAYLQLGLSDNVSYTYDPSRPEGDRITSITVDGAPIDPAVGYRIGGPSFLLQGGDNFWVFQDGTDTRDSGLVDRDAWIEYLAQNSPVSPDFARRSVQVTGYPAEVEAGQELTFGVAKLDLTSLGSPANTELTATWEGSAAPPVTIPVANGAATVTVTVPADAVGAATLVLVAAPSGTRVELPFTVTESVQQTTTALALSATTVTYGTAVTATATVTGAASGEVEFTWNGSSVTVALVDGVATTTLPDDLAVGTYQVVASFLGTDDAGPSTSDPVELTVEGIASTVDLKLAPSTTFPGLGALALVNVRAGGGRADGTVEVAVDGTVVETRELRFGLALVRVPGNLSPGKHTVTVTYLGDDTTAPSSDSATLTVRKWPWQR
ncbi:ExeM/NucH family extracellular endonuclease [Cellulomonas fimi]|uniref:ExeM/NucH family extracellular endonuclease n=1 Tax=Cellulomonas fimi TaxID=1708 RepID=A0A7Y0QHB2_CELFI|nr:ExeM/NucH family extracellular endonuclease [Cellulomonas fimi]NMR18992.1 ExeM/NucH family extracellular endonuclease [Cellulomonas fimi]